MWTRLSALAATLACAATAAAAPPRGPVLPPEAAPPVAALLQLGRYGELVLTCAQLESEEVLGATLERQAVAYWTGKHPGGKRA